MIRRIALLLIENVGTLLLAIFLSLTVWVLAVIAEDPNVEREYPTLLPVEIVGISSDMVIVGDYPEEISVRLRAPSSLWTELEENEELVSAQIELTNLQVGDHTLRVNIVLGISPVQVVWVDPAEISITIEPFVSKEIPITPSVIGEPALGFQLDALTMSGRQVQVSGPESLVEMVADVTARISITGMRETVTGDVRVIPLDGEGQQVSGVIVEPEFVNLTQQISQAGGYRDVAVKVETSGQLASGYRITNISVSPPTITVFSSNPEIVAEMPGFVSTLPLDLTQADDDLEIRLALDLPEDVSVVGDEQSVQVQVGIAAIETSITITVPIEVIGLGPGLSAEVSPVTVDVFLFGPIQTLEELKNEDVRIFVNLTDLEVGAHLVTAQEEVLSDRIVVDAIAPESIEVIITVGENGESTPTPTPSPTPEAGL